MDLWVEEEFNSGSRLVVSLPAIGPAAAVGLGGCGHVAVARACTTQVQQRLPPGRESLQFCCTTAFSPSGMVCCVAMTTCQPRGEKLNSNSVYHGRLAGYIAGLSASCQGTSRSLLVLHVSPLAGWTLRLPRPPCRLHERRGHWGIECTNTQGQDHQPLCGSGGRGAPPWSFVSPLSNLLGLWGQVVGDQVGRRCR